MRAWSPRTQALAPNSAFVASLLSEVTAVAFWALVDDGRLGQAGGQPEMDFVLWSLTTAKAALTAGVVAIGLAAVRRKAAPARAGTPAGWVTAGYRYATGESSSGWRRRIELPFNGRRWAL